jgi:hypothetical protein
MLKSVGSMRDILAREQAERRKRKMLIDMRVIVAAIAANYAPLLNVRAEQG